MFLPIWFIASNLPSVGYRGMTVSLFHTITALATIAALTACQSQPAANAPALSDADRSRRSPPPAAPLPDKVSVVPLPMPLDQPPPPHVAPDEPPQPPPTPLAASLTRAEWRRAENRASCAAIALTTDGGASATPRRAQFAGGWAIAFDAPQQRSAYGVAGAGLTDADIAAPADQRRRLLGQWPYFAELPTLPGPAFAGYGVVGAMPYPATNADGRGLHSLAYVRIGRERCTYNVWSRISRAHLETLLQSLRML